MSSDPKGPSPSVRSLRFRGALSSPLSSSSPTSVAVSVGIEESLRPGLSSKVVGGPTELEEGTTVPKESRTRLVVLGSDLEGHPLPFYRGGEGRRGKEEG